MASPWTGERCVYLCWREVVEKRRGVVRHCHKKERNDLKATRTPAGIFKKCALRQDSVSQHTANVRWNTTCSPALGKARMPGGSEVRGALHGQSTSRFSLYVHSVFLYFTWGQPRNVVHLRELKIRTKDLQLGKNVLWVELVPALFKQSLIWILPPYLLKFQTQAGQFLWPGICISQSSLWAPSGPLLVHEMIFGGTWTNIFFLF